MSETTKRTRGEGWVYPRGNRWWIGYYHQGEDKREAGGKTPEEAEKKLKRRLKQIAERTFVGAANERALVSKLLDELLLNLETAGARSLRTYRSYAKPLKAFFGTMRAVNVQATDVDRYIKHRLGADKEKGGTGITAKTIKNEIDALKQAFRLAHKRGQLARMPHFPTLKNADVPREGFFEAEEFEALAANLPEPVNDIARFGYITGWRKGEILNLRWDAVDRTAKEIRLRGSETKNGRPRVIPFMDELGDVIERRWQARQVTRPDGTSVLSEFVFHHWRRGAPRPFRDIDKSWAAATTAAKLEGRLFHDLRRTAVRNMIRAGVPETVAMQISGHRTRSMFDRYNITSLDDVRAALERVQAHNASARTAKRNVISFPEKGA